MLWEIRIKPAAGTADREGQRIQQECHGIGTTGVQAVSSTRSFLLEGELSQDAVTQAAKLLLCDDVVETFTLHRLPEPESGSQNGTLRGPAHRLNVLLRAGVTDSVADNARDALKSLDIPVDAAATCRSYVITGDVSAADLERIGSRVLANDAIEQIAKGPLPLTSLSVGSDYSFNLETIDIRQLSDTDLEALSRGGQLYLSLVEMQTIRDHFRSLERPATDIELETIAQTWSEHCSHKTLAGRIHYTETSGGETVRELQFENMLKETIFAATVQIREDLGDDDWCVSVFEDNAGIVKFDDNQSVCFKVETHNHPSAIEPYGGANTGLGGVIRDPLGTGLGARPVCNTDVFCFAPPETTYDSLPPGTLHPATVMRGVVSGVRDYGNRMGIPTVNGAVCFDERYLGNPLVYCGNVAMIPNDKCEKHMSPGDLIVAVGGRTGRDGIHGATFSSAELTQESEDISGGAVQIGNPVTEKMVADVILEARDRDLYTAITDCGAGGFSSAVGEMGEKTGALVWLEKCPLKYAGLSYTEVWISEAQERMVLAVHPSKWEEFRDLCAAEGVEATAIGEFTDDRNLVLTWEGTEVGRLEMSFLHDGRPPVIRDATFEIRNETDVEIPVRGDYSDDLSRILGSPNVASKEWIIRQYDHEVQAGSVVKPLVGVQNDGPSDAAVVRPDLTSLRGLAVSCGINPHLGDLDPWWMAMSAIDEAMRNCVAVGADPSQIAILDNFCWGNTERAETLGTLVRAALACREYSVALGTPFISGKDSLNNEFSYDDADGVRRTVAIPSTLLISALGQLENVEQAVTMDAKEAGNRLYLVGQTHKELGGSHFLLVNKLSGGRVPRVADPVAAKELFAAVHASIKDRLVRSCHDLSEGGLAVAAAEMGFAGELGLEIDLQSVPADSDVTKNAELLFSESNTRFLIEVAEAKTARFEEHFSDLPCSCIGRVTPTGRLQITGLDGSSTLDADMSTLKASWQSAFPGF